LVTNGAWPLPTATVNTELASESGAEAWACAMKGAASHTVTKRKIESRVFIAWAFVLTDAGQSPDLWRRVIAKKKSICHRSLLADAKKITGFA